MQSYRSSAAHFKGKLGCSSCCGRASKVHCAAESTAERRSIPHPSGRHSLSYHDPEEHRPYKYLHRGTHEISDYCINKAKGTEWDECMVVWNDVMDKTQKNEALLKDPERCEEAKAKLRELDNEIYTLYNRQPIRGVVKSLARHKRQREEHEAQRAAAARGEVASPPAEESEERDLTSQRRERLRAVYDQMDKNGDGYLSIMEFREALDIMGSHLDGQAVMKIIGVLGLEGRMDFDDFVAIVEVHCLHEESAESRKLRAVLHHHSHADFRKWVHSW